MEKLGLYAVIAALLFGGGYTMGVMSNENAQVVAENQQLQQNEVVIAADGQASAANQVTLDRLDQITKDTLIALPNPDNQCFDSNDVDQLRNLWGEKSP